MLKDAALLLLYMGHQAKVPSFWTKVVGAGVGLGLLLTIAALLTLLVRVLLVPRQLISLSDNTQTVLGKPLLFPVRFVHTRLRPVKDRFDNRFLVVGVPVGLRCRIGNLLAIDDKSLEVSPPPGGDDGSSWARILSHFSCWFSFDSVRFLHRGDHGLDLREKLDSFLRSENEDPAQWPYAYLLSVPQFLGWSRSVVTWWYLYSEQRELDAMILEINNSYWEKRNVFLRVRPASDKLVNPPEASERAEYLDDHQSVQSLPSAPRASFYKGTWHKYIFASPFEKVDGVVSNRLMDPVQPGSWKANAPFSNMTTLEDSGEVRMATRLTCDGPPIDPSQMSAFDVAKFLFRWTLPGMLTTPEIIFKALKIRFTGLMRMNSKPPVRSGSVGRHITKLEADLEPFFYAYLASCVKAYSDPVELTYLPCRSFTNGIIRMQSPSYRDDDSNARRLTVEPTDPQFYTKIIDYHNMRVALAQETKPAEYNADPTARRLIVSDRTLLASILEPASDTEIDTSMHTGYHRRYWRLRQILSWSRWDSVPTVMDDFALSSSCPSARAVYMSSCLRLQYARTFAFGSQKLLGIQIFLISCLIRWLVLKGLSLWGSIFFFDSLGPQWTTVISATGYFCVMRLLTETRNCLTQ